MLNNLGLGITVDVDGNAGGAFGDLGQAFGQFKSLLPPGIQQFGALAGKLGMVAGGAYVAYQAIKFIYNALDECTRAAGEFEYSMAYVSTVLSKEDMPKLKELGDAALDMSVKFGKSAQDMSRSIYQALSAGIKVAEVKDFVANAGILATGGAASMETVVDVLTSIKNAYGMSMSEMKKATDDMFIAVKVGKTEVPDLASTLGHVVPIASQLGISFQEVSAMTASLTVQGIKTSEAITGIRSAMVQYMRQSPAFVTAAQQAGIKFDRTTVNGMGFSKWLIYAADKAKAAGVNINKLFPDVEGLNAVLALTGKEGAKTASDALKEMANTTGAAQEAFSKMTDTLTFKQAQSDAAWEKFKIKIGEVFLPIRKWWTDLKTSIFEGLSDSIDANREAWGMMKAPFAATSNYIDEKWSKLSSKFAPIGNIFVNLKDKAAAWMESMVTGDSLIGRLRSSIDSFGDAGAGALDSVNGAVDSAIDSIGEGILKLPELTAGAFEKVAKLVIDSMTWIAERGLAIIEPIWKLMEEHGYADAGSFDAAKKSVSEWKTGKYASIEDTAGGIRNTMSDLMKESVKGGMEARDLEREKLGKDKPPIVNVDNTVNIGNKKVHESQRDWEEVFL